jgi:hypothetical protein
MPPLPPPQPTASTAMSSSQRFIAAPQR